MKIVTTLSRELLSDETKCVSVGRLPQHMIDFIESKKPDLHGVLSPNQDILFWSDRIKHTEQHKDDFISDIEFETCFSEIPSIISHPDYISVHPKDNSISFIKNYSGHVSVAVRISPNGNMAYRTMYPLMDAQLTNYISKNRAWKYEPESDEASENAIS